MINPDEILIKTDYRRILLFWIFVMFLMNCSSSKMLNQVKEPRNGRPINSRLAIIYSSRYQISILGLQKLHPFDINKYVRIYQSLVDDNLIEPSDIYVPVQVTSDQISMIHSKDYLRSLDESGNIATYLEAPLLRFVPSGILKRGVLKPFRYASGGTLLAARQALEYGVAVNMGGGYHHAKPDKGEGFCVYADIPIAIKALQAEGLISTALVIDLDVHQGNGTAVCFANDESVFTFSMHQGNIYPFPKEKSDLDIELRSGTDDARFLEILSKELPGLFDLAEPDIVFIVGGCDTLYDDPLASLSMTEKGIVKRDWMVIESCLDRNTPVIMTLAGGYSKNAWHAQYLSIKNIIEKITECPN